MFTILLPRGVPLHSIFSELASLADSSIEARRRGRSARPWVQVKAALQKRLLKETFQSYDQVATALAIAGIEEGWRKIASELREKANDVKHRLDAIVHRRHQIVHEGDMKRASRPRRLRFNGILHSEVKQDVDWVESLIGAMDKVMSGS